MLVRNIVEMDGITKMPYIKETGGGLLFDFEEIERTPVALLRLRYSPCLAAYLTGMCAVPFSGLTAPHG